MRTRVTEQGLLIPRELLGNIKEVEIHKERHVILILPVAPADPIFEFGTQPIVCDVNDASDNHDRYLYSQ